MHKLDDYLTQNPKQHLIFDLDETIVKLELPWDIFVDKAWEMFDGIDHKLVQANPHTITRTNNMMNMLIAEHGDDVKKEIYDYLEFFEIHYLKEVSLNDSLIEWLLENQKKYKYHLWTSQMHRTVEHVLQMVNLSGNFDKIVSRDMVKFTKPYPDGFDLIRTGLRVSHEKYLMVGDSEFDEQAAKRVKIDFFFEDFFKK